MHPETLLRIITCALVIGTATACAGEDDSEQRSLEQLKQESAEALQAFKQYSAEQRDEAVAKGRQALDAMDARIDALEERTREQWDDMSTTARDKREATLRSLRKQRRRLAEWYGGIKHSSSEAWQEVKDGFIGAYDSLSQSFTEAGGESNGEDGSGQTPSD